MKLAVLLACAALASTAPRAVAHEGPPYPVFVDRAVGPYIVSVWADPDVGTGTFYVMFDPPAHRSDSDPRIAMYTWPPLGRLPPKRYEPSVRRDDTYEIRAEFDSEETWSFRFEIEGSAGRGETEIDIPITPPGYGRWDLLVYGAPFVAVGVLWALVAVRKRSGWTGSTPRRG